MTAYDPLGTYTFYETVGTTLAGDVLTISTAEHRRLARYSTCWAFYHGRHWDFEREDGDPLVTLNYVKGLLNKLIAALIRKGVQWDMDLPFRETIQQEVTDAWEENGGTELLWRIAQMGSVSGDHFIMVTWREATELELQIRPDIRGYPVLELLNSSQVFPEWDPEVRGRMTKCTVLKFFYYPKADAPDELEVRHIKITITADEIIEEHPYEVVAGGGEGKVVRKKNLLGEVGVVHWANEPNATDMFGVSDALAIIPIQREFNEKATDVSDIINYNASPITLVFGARLSTIDKTAKTVWSNLPADAKVDTLEMKGELTASQNFMDMLRTAMHELANVPEGSLGAKEWNAETGEVLVSRMQPLMEAKDRKVTTWLQGVRRVNYFVIRLLNLMRNMELPKDRCSKSGGVIFTKLKDEDNALGQPVPVVTERVVVEYDAVKQEPKALTTKDISDMEADGQEVDKITFKHADYDNVTMLRLNVENPRPANPLRCDPVFPDTLPKDRVLTMNVLSQIGTLGLADREWLARHAPDIDNDEIPELMRRVKQQRIEDQMVEAMLADGVIDQTDADALKRLVDANGDMKRVMHTLSELAKKKKEEDQAQAEKEAELAGQKGATGRGEEAQQIQPGKKRRGEK